MIWIENAHISNYPWNPINFTILCNYWIIPILGRHFTIINFLPAIFPPIYHIILISICNCEIKTALDFEKWYFSLHTFLRNISIRLPSKNVNWTCRMLEAICFVFSFDLVQFSSIPSKLIPNVFLTFLTLRKQDSCCSVTSVLFWL